MCHSYMTHAHASLVVATAALLAAVWFLRTASTLPSTTSPKVDGPSSSQADFGFTPLLVMHVELQHHTGPSQVG